MATSNPHYMISGPYAVMAGMSPTFQVVRVPKPTRTEKFFLHQRSLKVQNRRRASVALKHASACKTPGAIFNGAQKPKAAKCTAAGLCALENLKMLVLCSSGASGSKRGYLSKIAALTCQLARGARAYGITPMPYARRLLYAASAFEASWHLAPYFAPLFHSLSGARQKVVKNKIAARPRQQNKRAFSRAVAVGKAPASNVLLWRRESRKRLNFVKANVSTTIQTKQVIRVDNGDSAYMNDSALLNNQRNKLLGITPNNSQCIHNNVQQTVIEYNCVAAAQTGAAVDMDVDLPMWWCNQLLDMDIVEPEPIAFKRTTNSKVHPLQWWWDQWTDMDIDRPAPKALNRAVVKMDVETNAAPKSNVNRPALPNRRILQRRKTKS